MNLLALSDYFTENLPLLIVIIVIAALILATVIAMIVLGVKAKKKKAEEPKPVEEKAEEPKPVEQKAEEPKPVEEKAEEPKPVEQKAEEPKPVEEKAEETKPKVVPVIIKQSERNVTQVAKEDAMEKKDNVKKPEPAKKAEPVKKAEPAKKAEPVKAPEPVKKAEPVKAPEPAKKAEPAKGAPKPAAAVPAKKQEPAKVSAAAGKWVIEPIKGKYWLSLIAPNGQVMLESPTAYASLSSARSGIKTYQENIAAGRMEITEHKNGDSQVQILNGRGLLLATSSTYSTRTQAESALGSIKRWSVTEAVEVLEEKK